MITRLTFSFIKLGNYIIEPAVFISIFWKICELEKGYGLS